MARQKKAKKAAKVTKRGSEEKPVKLPDQLGAEIAAGSQASVIGKRLRAFRTERKFSQGDIEKRSGLLRCYISRVENGYTIPSIATLEKMAAALEIPLYRLFYGGDKLPAMPPLAARAKQEEAEEKDPAARRLRKFITRMDDRGRQVLLQMAQKMAAARG